MLEHFNKYLISLAFGFICSSATATPTQVIIPYTPGGGVDAVYRIFEKFCISKKIDIVPVYKPGASGVVGTLAMANAEKNGKTIGLTGVYPIAETLEKYPDAEYELISLISSPTMVLVTGKSNSIKSFQDLKTVAKTDKVLSVGYGATAQKSAVVKLLSYLDPKLKPTLVPFNGGNPVAVNLAGGHIDIGIIPAVVARPMIDSGKLILLASTAKGDDVINLQEALKWINPNSYGIVAPIGSPSEVIKFWTDTVKEFLSDPTVKKELQSEFFELTKFGSTNFRQSIDAAKKSLTD